MFAPYYAFKKPEILDEERHRRVKVKLPFNFAFLKNVETVPIGFSEILPLTMYYPVMIGSFRERFFPFVIMGIKNQNVYVNEEGGMKVPAVPKACELYPFFVIKEGEEGEESWSVILDMSMACRDDEECEDGKEIFDDFGEPTEFFREIKGKLTQLALDFEKAIEFCEYLKDKKIIASINLEVSCKYGTSRLKNVYIADVEKLKNIKPEVLYYLNTQGYLSVLYAMYFSARNFKLFDLI